MMCEFVETELGNLPATWTVKTVEELVQEEVLKKPLDGNHGNIHPKGADFVKEGIPFIMASDVNNGKVDLVNCKFIRKAQADSLQKGFSKTGDVLLTHKASLGRTAIVQENLYPYIMLTPQVTYYRVLDPNRLVNKYLKYYFDSPVFQDTLVNHGDSGSTRSYVGITAQRELPVIFPPIEIQSSIAQTLGSLDDKIDLLHSLNQTLEQMAETLFRQWFVENPNPEWGESPLSSIATFLNGLACQKYPPENDVDKLPVLKIKQLRSGISDDCDWCTTEVDNKFIVHNGDVIFSWSASLMVKIWDGETCVLNQHLFKVSSDKYPKWFYYLWSKFHLNQFVAIAKAHATTMGHIKRGDLDEAMVCTPSNIEIKQMTIHFEPIIDKVIKNNKQINTLTVLRDILLPKLLGGEVNLDENFKEESA